MLKSPPACRLVYHFIIHWCYIARCHFYCCVFVDKRFIFQKWKDKSSHENKKPLVHFIIKIFLIENECKTPIFSSDEMDIQLIITLTQTLLKLELVVDINNK